MADKKPTAKPIKDIAHPGESAPSPNSKSVIISNRPLLKDPMMVDKSVPEKDPSDDSLAGVSNKSAAKLTAPLLETEEPDETAPATKAAKPPKPKAKTPDETADETPAEAPEDEPPIDEPDDAAKPAEAPAETPTEETTSPKNKTKQAAEAEAKAEKEAKRLAAIDKLAASKKYYLPVNAVEKRKARHFVILGVLLAVLLAAAWADIALDAGLIHVNGIKPPTHFFSN